MAEHIKDDSSPDTDKDFEPSADMMVHDFDDEHTLEQEENQSNSDGGNELADLEKEGEMPMEELLAMYGYGGAGNIVPAAEQESRSSSEEEILSNQDLTLDKDEVARDLLPDDEDSNKETSATDLLDSVDIPSQTVRLLRSADNQDEAESDDSEDIDYEPVEDGDWKKAIQVGRDFQATIPDGLHKYDDAPAYENEDRLLWDPQKLPDKEVEGFLREIQQQSTSSAPSVKSIPQGSHIRDDEQALYLLLQCGHNVEEALRRRKMQAVPPTDPMSLWSEEECRNYENGLKSYGKDFYLIQQNKVRTRSVGELVQFYYLWKKTERHDMFANKNRLEKKKYALHPGVTDYMDRFLDEQENQPPNKERPASPLNSLLYGDPKRHQPPDLTPKTPTQEEIAAVVEMVQKVVDENQVVDFANKLTEIAPDLHATPSPAAQNNQQPPQSQHPLAISAGGDCATAVLAHNNNSSSSTNSMAEVPAKTVTGGVKHPASSSFSSSPSPVFSRLSELSTNTTPPVVGTGGGDHNNPVNPATASTTADSTTGEPQSKRQRTSPPNSLPDGSSSKRLEHSNNCIVNSSHTPLDNSQSLSGSKPLEDEQNEHRVTSSLGNIPITTTSFGTSSVHSFSDSKIVSFGGESNATAAMSVSAEAMAH